MPVYPEDLPLDWQVAIVRKRAGGADDALDARAVADPPAPHLGLLGRLWSRGVTPDPGTAAATLPAVGEWMRFSFYSYLSYAAGAAIAAWSVALAGHSLDAAVVQWTLTAAAAGLGGAAFALPRARFRALYGKPLTPGELLALLEGAPGAVERAYLRLLLEAARQPLPPELGPSVRASLRAMGEALRQLPAPEAAPEAAALAAEADQAALEAGEAQDSAVAAALERRAGALRQRVRLLQLAEGHQRRVAAARDALGAQIDAFRLTLTTLGASEVAVAEVLRIAEQVRGITTEALCVAAARTELDSVLNDASPPGSGARPAPAFRPDSPQLGG